jgi:hypothetical protein
MQKLSRTPYPIGVALFAESSPANILDVQSLYLMNFKTHQLSVHGRTIQLTLKPSVTPNCRKIYIEAAEGTAVLCGLELTNRISGWHLTPPIPQWVVGLEQQVLHLVG